MSKYRKLIDWVIGLIVTIFFLYGPAYFFVINPYVNPYKIPIILFAPPLLLSIPAIQNIPTIAAIMHIIFVTVSFSFNNNGDKNITIIGAK